jgi:exopolyphosphatase/guanosine-5'-triphosphate,3'-diphosphate pyrophosphatase
MEAAEVVPGLGTRILASDREVTRLGESVFRTGAVSEEALKATCAVLSRMAGLYRKLDVAGVRAVATSAIRDTRNQREFLARATEAAGTGVEIISGREEARLIHLGVESNWPQPGKRVLVIDIGGGSAEIIAAENGRMIDAYSKPLGAMRLKEAFLKDDPPSARQLRQMREYIQAKLDAPVRRLGQAGWDRVIATSATAATVAGAIARAPRGKRDDVDKLRVTTAQVRKLYAKLSVLGLAGRRKVTGIGPRRAEIIVPGMAVLLEFLERFHVPGCYYSRAGVRDGIIADLAQRNVEARTARGSPMISGARWKRWGGATAWGWSIRGRWRRSGTCCSARAALHGLPSGCGKLLEAAAYLHDVVTSSAT